MERHGARNCRLWHQGVAGARTGTFVTTFEYDNMRTFGKVRDAVATDPEGQALAELVQGSDSPITPVANNIYTETQR